MSAPYIAEVQTAHWTSDAIRDVFKADNFDLHDFPLTQHLEKNLPAGKIFYSTRHSKLFGLQYKTLYGNGRDFWPLDPTQHKTLQRFPWIFYCYSELKHVADRSRALPVARFYRFPQLSPPTCRV